jgi:mannosylglycerate hydrolase
MNNNEPFLKEKTNIHIISHNHWDREWIFTAQYTNNWLIPFFKNLFDKMEAESDYKFVLDGQTLMIDDYFNLLNDEDEITARKKLSRFASEGRLQIGPAYLQPDWGLVSGESLVRNFLIGTRQAEKFGGIMKAGWLLDNFGQIAQAPQIFKGFGIEGCFVWRGVELDNNDPKTEFWWEAPDGSKVLAVYLLDSYRNAMVLSATPEIAQERIKTLAKGLRPVASTSNVLLMNGYEQVPFPDDVLPMVKEFNETHPEHLRLHQSTPEEFINAIKSENPQIPTYKGYFYSGKYMPILKGVFSSRSKLKSKNNLCQRELERWAEPFAVLSWHFGKEYPANTLNKSWKTLLVNHTHDDVCGCNIDPIARDMHDRFDEVLDTAKQVSDTSLKAITDTIDTQHDNAISSFVVFNPSSRNRTRVVGFVLEISNEVQDFLIEDSSGNHIPYQVIERNGTHANIYLLVSDVPAMGYKTFFVVNGKSNHTINSKVTASEKDNSLENEHIKINIQSNGTITLENKRTGNVYTDLGYYEDGGDCGDTYDYSYPHQDKIINSLNANAKIDLMHDGPLYAMFKVSFDMELPKALKDNRMERSDELYKYPITFFVTLSALAKRVGVYSYIKNTVKDHRLRLMLPSDVKSDFSYAEEPFDIAKFPIKEEIGEYKLHDKIKDIMVAGRYTEPVNTRIFQNFVGINDNERHLSVLSSRLSEYEVLEDRRTIALTVIRSVGWLARQDLLTRIGDVGPYIYTPEAQEIGDHYFTFSIYPLGGEDLEKDVPYVEADNHNLRLRVVGTNIHQGKLPKEYSLLCWEDEFPRGALRMTAVKRSEDEESFIFRFYNMLEKPSKGKLKIAEGISSAYLVNLNEEIQKELVTENNSINLEVGPKEIVTLKIKLKNNEIIEPKNYKNSKVYPLLTPKAEFGKVKSMPVLTRAQVKTERERWKVLKVEFEEAERKEKVAEREIKKNNETDPGKLGDFQKLKTEVLAVKRKMFEARISSLLNEQLYVNTLIDDELTDMGPDFAWVRISKRVGEYLSNHYTKEQKYR